MCTGFCTGEQNFLHANVGFIAPIGITYYKRIYAYYVRIFIKISNRWLYYKKVLLEIKLTRLSTVKYLNMIILFLCP